MRRKFAFRHEAAAVATDRRSDFYFPVFECGVRIGVRAGVRPVARCRENGGRLAIRAEDHVACFGSALIGIDVREAGLSL